jgi:hypothetical protein
MALMDSTQTRPRLSFDNMYRLWLEIAPVAGWAGWDGVVRDLSEVTGMKISPAAAAKLRRYIRRTYAPDLYR